jgi:hypothetical protein
VCARCRHCCEGGVDALCRVRLEVEGEQEPSLKLTRFAKFWFFWFFSNPIFVFSTSCFKSVCLLIVPLRREDAVTVPR